MVCPKNACAGGYGNCIDVKITNSCNGSCAFCIEKDGYSPDEQASPAKLAMETVAHSDFPTVLILGGEPTMYTGLTEYLSYIRPYKKNIFMTTNGSLLKQPYQDVDLLGKYLDGINISVHHFTEEKNDMVLRGGTHTAPAGRPNLHVSFDMLKAAIRTIHQHDCNVRINTNLVKDFIETRNDVNKMIELAVWLGADAIRFTELQDAEDNAVNAYKLFSNLPADPFRDGCEVTVPTTYPIQVIVKVTCGRVNANRPPVCEQPVRTGKTIVIYPNGETKSGWCKSKHAPPSNKPSAAQTGCHPMQPDISGGCHPMWRN